MNIAAIALSLSLALNWACGEETDAGKGTTRPPQSGFIHTQSYGTDKDGNVRGQKRQEKVWFKGHNTRRESYLGDVLATVNVQGKTNWVAFPAAGRIGDVVERESPDCSPYPQQVKAKFGRAFGKREVSEESSINDLACWKYLWHEDARTIGCMRSSARDVAYWVLANPSFPAILRYESSQGGRRELKELKLDIGAPDEVFQPPNELKAMKRMALPEKRLEVEIHTVRASQKYGWTVRTSEALTGDGRGVKYSCKRTKTLSKGTATTLQPSMSDLTYAEAKGQLESLLKNPDWGGVAEVKEEEWAGLEADVLENIIHGLPGWKYWVVDHPVLGTICVRKECLDDNEFNQTKVTRIIIGGRTWVSKD